MILWTIQHADAWAQLQRTGILRADPARVAEEFRRGYDWMAGELAKRIGPPPDGVRYPLWAWYQWEGVRKRQDLRRSGYGPRGTPMVQLTIEIDDDVVLLSEFDRWNIVLGCGYLARDEADFDRPSGPTEGSWARAFALDQWTPGWDASPEEQSIQAVFWELRMEQVRKAEHFTAK